MAIRTGILFCTLLLGSFALPVPEDDIDMSIFFQTSDPSASPEERIVGGSVAAVGAHPWMVALTNGGSVRAMNCGASILTQRTVLTAAHCITGLIIGNVVNENVRVNVGTNFFNSGGQSLTVNGFALHPEYSEITIKNDIATLFTSSNINFNNLVRAIPVSYDWVGGGVQARVAGWGMMGADLPVSQQLLEISVPTMEGNACLRGVELAASNQGLIVPPLDSRIEICTFHSTGTGVCRGDSGSPLVRADRNQQIGVVSWGFPCARGAPDVYTRVSAYQTWIQQNTL